MKMLLMKRVKGEFYGAMSLGRLDWSRWNRLAGYRARFEEETKLKVKALYNAQFLELGLRGSR